MDTWYLNKQRTFSKHVPTLASFGTLRRSSLLDPLKNFSKYKKKNTLKETHAVVRITTAWYLRDTFHFENKLSYISQNRLPKKTGCNSSNNRAVVSPGKMGSGKKTMKHSKNISSFV